MRRWAVLFAMAASFGAPLAVASPTSEARRETVDITEPPWNAIVRVQTNLATRCGGTLIAPNVVLTAAHCLINKRTRALLGAVSLHVLTGYARGDFATHHRVVAVTSGDGFDPANPLATLARDWAVLTLDSPVAGVAPLPVATQFPKRGGGAVAPGFHADKKHLLMVDPDCAIRGRRETPLGPLITDDCAASHGTSGGPLLLKSAGGAGGWRIGGVVVAKNATTSFAVPPSAWLAAAQAAGAVVE